MQEVASFRFPDGDTWAFKTPRIEPDGDFYVYGNDVARGLDVYRYTAAATPSTQARPLADAGRGPEPAPGLGGRLSDVLPYGVVVDSVKVSVLL